MSLGDHVALAGSERGSVDGAQVVGAPDPAEPMSVTLVLRRSGEAKDPMSVDAERVSRQPLSRRELSEARSVPREAMAAVAALARAYDLVVTEDRGGSGAVVLAGPTSAMERAFAVRLSKTRSRSGQWRARRGPVHLPSTLLPFVGAVLGLDDRPQAIPHVLTVPADPQAIMPKGITAPEMARRYGLSRGATGKGRCIAVLAFNAAVTTDADPLRGGGFQTDDLLAYARLVQEPTAASDVIVVPCAGGANRYGINLVADMEISADIEVASTIAPGAKIVVYVAPDTAEGYVAALRAAVHDDVNRPDVITISWGMAEETWTGQAVWSIQDLLDDASRLGITVVASVGDKGSADAVDDGRAHVDFPGSSPHVTACGGTEPPEGGAGEERVWNDASGATGGGVSALFPLPFYQEKAGVPPSANAPHAPGRGIPDLAASASANAGYRIILLGQEQVAFGTSMVAPLVAGWVAQMNEVTGARLGLLNPTLYARGDAFQGVTQGDNGAYRAQAGWNPCAGLGTPRGDLLSAAVAAAATRPPAPPR